MVTAATPVPRPASPATLRRMAAHARERAPLRTEPAAAVLRELAAELDAAADALEALAALTPETVAAVRSARSYRWPHAGPEERAALDAGLAALERLHPDT